MKDIKESYAHYQAKVIFASWLREVARNSKDESCDFGGLISWRVNRGENEGFGVFEEYPLTDGFTTVWDEQEWSHHDPEYTKSYPDYEWMKKNSKSNFRIADIVIQHKGSIAYIIEIVHKNDVSIEKLKFYKNLPLLCNVFAVPTQWVLGQINIPKELPNEFKLW